MVFKQCFNDDSITADLSGVTVFLYCFFIENIHEKFAYIKIMPTFASQFRKG